MGVGLELAAAVPVRDRRACAGMDVVWGRAMVSVRGTGRGGGRVRAGSGRA